jgi:hypothetical protein
VSGTVLSRRCLTKIGAALQEKKTDRVPADATNEESFSPRCGVENGGALRMIFFCSRFAGGETGADGFENAPMGGGIINPMRS